tara:strand:+ start:619 stop:732 length:114 start_codon:yes stop_codon:yes gene_type:complete
MILFGQRRVLKKATNGVLCPKEQVVELKAKKKLQEIG